jgi:hypothetical protein
MLGRIYYSISHSGNFLTHGVLAICQPTHSLQPNWQAPMVSIKYFNGTYYKPVCDWNLLNDR